MNTQSYTYKRGNVFFAFAPTLDNGADNGTVLYDIHMTIDADGTPVYVGQFAYRLDWSRWHVCNTEHGALANETHSVWLENMDGDSLSESLEHAARRLAFCVERAHILANTNGAPFVLDIYADASADGAYNLSMIYRGHHISLARYRDGFTALDVAREMYRLGTGHAAIAPLIARVHVDKRDEVNIASFDGGYGRDGIISIDTAQCDICGDYKVILSIDGSEGEYGAGAICEECSRAAFAAYAANNYFALPPQEHCRYCDKVTHLCIDETQCSNLCSAYDNGKLR